MQRDMVDLQLILNGEIFSEINEQYEKEQKLMREGSHMLTSKMGEIYMDVFTCNERIKLIKTETFGDIIIDDNHIVIEWDIDGCMIEFYYEQFWDIMELKIGKNNFKKAIEEIIIAFEYYYNKKFIYCFSEEVRRYEISGQQREHRWYKLQICE